MKRKIIASIAACFLIISFFSGCKSESKVQKQSEEDVTFFTEEATLLKEQKITKVYTEGDIHFDDTYIYEENGRKYEMALKDIQTERVDIDGRTVNLVYNYQYPVDVVKPNIPETVEVTYYDNELQPPKNAVTLTDAQGNVAGIPITENLKPGTYTLTLKGVTDGGYYWNNDFAAPMVFHNYDAYMYEIGGVYIPHDDNAPVVAGYESAYLNYLGLSESSYRVSSAAWDGAPYTDENGILCRNATLYGSRYINSYTASYEGKVLLPTVKGYSSTATYTWRGIVPNTKRIITVATGGSAVLGGGIFIPIVFFKRRKRKEAQE